MEILSLVPMSVKVVVGASGLMLLFKKQLIKMLKKNNTRPAIFSIFVVVLMFWIALS